MPSAKQIAWRKKFARMSKAGKFRKAKKSKRFSISSSERRQTKNLDVYSPPPESYKIVTGTTQAKKVAKEKRKMYAKVKIWKIKE